MAGMPPRLQVVTVSTRQGRKGPAVSRWFEQIARDHGGFDIDPVDLAEIGLSLFDEPEHPRLRRYVHEHTRRWSARVEQADAFVFVMPEYNNSTPPSLVNALDHLLSEWAYKPVGFVSYGGISGGLRAVQMTKPLISALKMVPLVEAVTLPLFTQSLDAETGTFAPGDKPHKAATVMLDELRRWTDALRVLRTPPSP